MKRCCSTLLRHAWRNKSTFVARRSLWTPSTSTFALHRRPMASVWSLPSAKTDFTPSHTTTSASVGGHVLPVRYRRSGRRPTGRKRSTQHARRMAQRPLFNDLLKQLFLKTHPDFFQQFPKVVSHNSDTMQVIQEILNMCKDSTDEWPEQAHRRLFLYTRAPPGGKPRRVNFVLSTTGTRCPAVMANGLSDLFRKAGVLNNKDGFRWDDEYWPMPAPQNKEELKRKAQTGEGDVPEGFEYR